MWLVNIFVKTEVMLGGGNLAGLKQLTSFVNMFKQVLVYPFFRFLCLTFRGTTNFLVGTPSQR